MSQISRSASLPVPTSRENPIPRASARESTDPRMPPLCEASPTLPGVSGCSSSATLGESTMLSSTFTSPIVFGPSSRIAPARFLKLGLPLRPDRADLRVAAGQHDRRGRADPRQLPHRLGHPVRPDQHQPDVRRRRQRLDRRVAAHPLDLRGARVHRVDRAADSRASAGSGAAGRPSGSDRTTRRRSRRSAAGSGAGRRRCRLRFWPPLAFRRRARSSRSRRRRSWAAPS